MRTHPAELHGRTFDLLVIGGGIQGAALAREAALRGCSTVLVEKVDFGWGTSSRSSRLVHGGLRYLEHGHLSLVREGLRERERLLRLAPHLVHPLPMLMPFFRGRGKNPLLVKLGLRLYGLLAGRSSLPPCRSLGPDNCRRAFPRLRPGGLRGGVLFFDAVTEDQRLTLAVVEAAQQAGAKVVNHLEVIGRRQGRVLLRDRLEDREILVGCKQLLNAAGPQADRIRRLFSMEREDLIRVSRGSHLILEPMEVETALAAFLPDQRIQFVIPHQDGTICGTTEVEVGSEVEDEPGEIPVPEEDLCYLLQALEHLLEEPPGRGDIRYAYAGLRALPRHRGPAGGVSREAFLVEEACAVGQLHTVVGGKLTTHRAFAERCVNKLLGLRGASPSRQIPLPGGEGPQEVADPLWWRHGSRAPLIRRLGQEVPALMQPICPHRDLLRAEAVHAIRDQAAMTFSDTMLRRLFHSQGPCLEEACLRSMYELHAEHSPYSSTFEQARSDLVLAVERTVGAAARPLDVDVEEAR